MRASPTATGPEVPVFGAGKVLEQWSEFHDVNPIWLAGMPDPCRHGTTL